MNHHEDLQIYSIDTLPLALTVPETAAILKIGKSSTYALVRSGQLRSIKIGRKIRIPKNALAEFLSNLN